jgi:quinoprotein dehydrogenase-associated probable ABC transporter substrate-binding protein
VCAAACLAIAPVGAVLPAGTGAEQMRPGEVLRVCADPSNLPLSNRAGEGYENKLAQALAADLGRRVEYTFFPQRMGFVRNTLKARDASTGQWKCDLIMGVPKGYELTATTRPYLRSTYAMVYRQRPELAGLSRPEDVLRLPAGTLRALRFGVFSKSPGVDWLLRHELLDQAVFFASQSGDPEESPAMTLERELSAKRIDIGIAWGPIAGLLLARHAGEWASVPFAPDPQIRFDYEISMGVRFGENEWKDTLDRWIAGHRETIRSILAEYRIPIVG